MVKIKSAYTSKDHTFAICAYGNSPYLRECIESVINQDIQTNILIATSTPNDDLVSIADEYNIKIFVNKAAEYSSNIAIDWNFAYACATTRLVTITHQDDIYYPQYSKSIISELNRAEHPLIAFTDYAERRDGDEVIDNRLLNVKKTMLFPLRNQRHWKSIMIRRRILSLGSAICCPSVTFVKNNIPEELFVPGYRSDIDWQAWERLSKFNGEFVYCHDVLMSHRIHADSATTAIIADNDRSKEDFEMFCKFWPKWFARILEHFYRKGEKQNGIS